MDVRKRGTVDVKGDERSYEQAISLRAVISEDAMTADWARLTFYTSIQNAAVSRKRRLADSPL